MQPEIPKPNIWQNLHLISGGQSGVDRAVLDFALANKLKVEGYCPKNRWAEDGTIDPKYPLIETVYAHPSYRSIKNLLIADALLVICEKKPDHGTLLTLAAAKYLNKPVLTIRMIHTDMYNPGNWLQKHAVKKLNIAGSRESSEPGIYMQCLKFLESQLF